MKEPERDANNIENNYINIFMYNFNYRFMKKNHLSLRGKTCGIMALAISALCFTSCAVDGYDDEEYTPTVTNSVLVSPNVDDITVVASADGKTQTLTWPVVHGAGGYLVSLWDVNNPGDSIVADSIVDGCSVTVPRMEAMYYVFSIKTLGNEEFNNTGAETPTEFNFTTFMPATAVIPNGTDIYEWSQGEDIKALIETPTEETLIFDLEEGGQYTLSNIVDFGHNKVLLRTAHKTNWATITYANGASIQFGGGFTLRYMNIDGNETTDPILGLSPNPNEAIKGLNNHYIINDPVTVQNCYVYNVQRQFLHDTKVKYCVATFLMENTMVNFTTDTGMSGGSYFQIYDGGGFINDFTIRNCTFWNSINKDGAIHHAKYFLRYNNAGRCDRADFTKNSINMYNCTFYNIVKTGQMANHGGFDGRATSEYEILNNIFVDCGSGQVPRRIVGRVGNADKTIFNNNTYWIDGAAESVESTSQYDTGYQLQSDPAFVDAENGNFEPTGAEQVALMTGDPRWFPTAE